MYVLKYQIFMNSERKTRCISNARRVSLLSLVLNLQDLGFQVQILSAGEGKVKEMKLNV